MLAFERNTDSKQGTELHGRRWGCWCWCRTWRRRQPIRHLGGRLFTQTIQDCLVRSRRCDLEGSELFCACWQISGGLAVQWPSKALAFPLQHGVHLWSLSPRSDAAREHPFRRDGYLARYQSSRYLQTPRVGGDGHQGFDRLDWLHHAISPYVS